MVLLSKILIRRLSGDLFLGFRLRSRRYLSSFDSEAKRTPLYDLHVNNNGKMSNFSGYSLPLYYANQGHLVEHNSTRKAVGLFDVSHMLQVKIHGKNVAEFLASITVADVKNLAPGSCALTLFTNFNGGIKDDLIVSNHGDYYYIVGNGACASKDLNLLKASALTFNEKSQGNISVQPLVGSGLIALQGPKSQELLQSVLPDIDFSRMNFMTNISTNIPNYGHLNITRCGYTGEDGFEISVENGANTQSFVERLFEAGKEKGCGLCLAGLAARDSLRLEAGLCLYGSDIDESSSPVEAGLTWAIPKTRRLTGNFPGSGLILEQLRQVEGVRSRRLVGLVTTEGAPIRPGCPIFDINGQTKIGGVTSGSPSPTLNLNIAMGYVNTVQKKTHSAPTSNNLESLIQWPLPSVPKTIDRDLVRPQLERSPVPPTVLVQVRKKMQKAFIIRPPFVQPVYFRLKPSK